ncbi:MAG: LytTR family transcriptional regulator [Ruminococcus sp.]|nr:LytTR family transcriptional regulator [Ruminococcus sp.]
MLTDTLSIFLTDVNNKLQSSKFIYFESLRKQLRIVTDSQEIMIYAKLTDILSKSFSKRFLRIHQSFLVNIQYIAEYCFPTDKTYLSTSEFKTPAEFVSYLICFVLSTALLFIKLKHLNQDYLISSYLLMILCQYGILFLYQLSL